MIPQSISMIVIHRGCLISYLTQLETLVLPMTHTLTRQKQSLG